jgi:hypothetical protein
LQWSRARQRQVTVVGVAGAGDIGGDALVLAAVLRNPRQLFAAVVADIDAALLRQGEQFGEIRLEAVIRGAGGKGPLALADELSARLDEFTAGRAQADDITFVVAQRTPMEKGS